jgi:hypothetical protein
VEIQHTFGFFTCHRLVIRFNFSIVVVVVFSFLPGNDNHYLTSMTNFGLSAALLGLFLIVDAGICLSATSPVSRAFSIFSLSSFLQFFQTGQVRLARPEIFLDIFKFFSSYTGPNDVKNCKQ